MENSHTVITAEEILKKFPHLVEFKSGNQKIQVHFPSPPWNIKRGSLVFVHKKQYLENLPKKEALLIRPHHLDTSEIPSSYCVMTSSNLKLAMAKICSYFFPVEKRKFYIKNHTKSKTESKASNIHPTACIGENAEIAEGVSIGAFALIGDGVQIGESSFIGSHCVIGKGVKIGKSTMIHPHVYVDSFCEIGNECEIQSKTSIGSEGFGYATDQKNQHFRIPHYGKVILGDAVFIGSNVSIDRGTFEDTVIGEGTKIDNHIHIAHNVQIGKHCIMTAGLIVAGSAKIGNRCHIGGRTTIKGHIEITDDVHLASYSVVTNSIPQKGVYGGIPILMPLKKAIQYVGVFPYLPEMKKNIRKLIKELDLQAKKVELLEKELQAKPKTPSSPSSSASSLSMKNPIMDSKK